ncbi:MAG TPA: serine hydrolase domain-containing protein, partial [Candidatus Eremiobacteraceae bacterium]|nr:serine hydrolase domain-containing protein [Candidatus Eremiobacteraceae bacterium]
MSLRSVLACALGLSALLPIAASTGVGSQAPLPLPITPALREKIDRLARQALAEQHLAGFSLAIAHDGRIIYTQGYGYRIVAKQLPATPNTIYNIGSITKQFTATAVMLLQQDGKLNVEDPVARFIPGLPWGRQVTVRQLLNHTSGVPDYLSIVDNNSLTMPKILAALRKTHLKFAPGSIYQYSNSNYILLGTIVSKASGIPYDDFLRRRILQPFGLEATSIGTTPLSLPDGAIGYTVVKGHT